eukprot:7223453-Alexandrium_andersonii.AAC.1
MPGRAFAPSPSARQLQMLMSTRTLLSFGPGLQMASATQLSFRRASRQLQAVEDFETREDIDISHWTSRQKQDIVPMRWVQIDKTPALARCRLVAKGFKERIPDKDFVFEATPAFFAFL